MKTKNGQLLAALSLIEGAMASVVIASELVPENHEEELTNMGERLMFIYQDIERIAKAAQNHTPKLPF